jgi:hypothetical protein
MTASLSEVSSNRASDQLEGRVLPNKSPVRISEWRSANRQILNTMFSKRHEMSKLERKEILGYLRDLKRIWEGSPDRYLLAHSTLAIAVGRYFDLLGWDVGFELPFADFDSSYRFDVVAQKTGRTVVIEVKPEVTTKALGQVLGYVFDVEKKLKRARVLLATDILNFPVVITGGEITDIIVDNAERHGLGVMLADKKDAWLIPAEFLTI